MRKAVRIIDVIGLGVLLSAALAASACNRCAALDGVALDPAYSFDLLRPGPTAGDPVPGGVPTRIRIFSEQVAHWDMDAACRIASLTRVAEIEDPARIKEFVDTIRRDVTEGDPAALSPACGDEAELYHLFLPRAERVGYILVRRCRAADGTSRGRMANYNADGDVSLRSATGVVRLINTLHGK
jgi:hypothetical protein